MVLVAACTSVGVSFGCETLRREQGHLISDGGGIRASVTEAGVELPPANHSNASAASDPKSSYYGPRLLNNCWRGPADPNAVGGKKDVIVIYETRVRASGEQKTDVRIVSKKGRKYVPSQDFISCAEREVLPVMGWPKEKEWREVIDLADYYSESE